MIKCNSNFNRFNYFYAFHNFFFTISKRLKFLLYSYVARSAILILFNGIYNNSN